jgi:hypothetical protein
MSPKRRTSALLASAVVASGIALTGPASPASAYPSVCTHSVTSWNNGGAATCASGRGSYRVVIGCRNMFGWWANRWGPWYRVGSGEVSRVSCPWGYQVKWSGLNARD